MRTADVRVACPSGLSASDEFVLWGLLALTFAQPEPVPELHASPHYCLRQLGVITANDRKGGKQYALFRESIRRIAQVTYMNTRFYDPIRAEHRDVAFGFLKYSLPIVAESSRAWRFIWDTQFFEICRATGGSLFFDLDMYRRLDFASRRLFVLLQKIFHRSEVSPAFDVRELCVAVLGFSPSVEVCFLKVKLAHCIERLAAEGVVQLPGTISSARELFAKQGVGRYDVMVRRGPYFERSPRMQFKLTASDQPFVEQLRQIGFEDAAVARIVRTYKPAEIRDWADVTLAAREQFGEKFFKKSAVAFFLDNVKHAAAGTRTPPDWWRRIQVKERERQQAIDRQPMTTGASATSEMAAFRAYLENEARETFDAVVSSLVEKLKSQERPIQEARETARDMAKVHMLNRFRREHPELQQSGFERVQVEDLRERFGI
jgi:hypothetical protein